MSAWQARNFWYFFLLPTIPVALMTPVLWLKVVKSVSYIALGETHVSSVLILTTSVMSVCFMSLKTYVRNNDDGFYCVFMIFGGFYGFQYLFLIKWKKFSFLFVLIILVVLVGLGVIGLIGKCKACKALMGPEWLKRVTCCKLTFSSFIKLSFFTFHCIDTFRRALVYLTGS